MCVSARARAPPPPRQLVAAPWVVSFEGRYHTITAAGLNPLPLQRPIPIWIGGFSEPALRRIARLADGYFPGGTPLGAGWRETLERMRGWRQEAGRNPADLGIEPRLETATGTADDWRRQAEEWRSLGATHLSVNTMGGGLSGAQAHIERITHARAALADL